MALRQAEGDGCGGAERHQLGGRALGDDRAVHDHPDAIGQVLGLVHVVRGQQHRRSGGAQVAHHVPGLAARRRVEARRGLVQEQQLRVAGEGDRHVEAALLAAGELAHALIALPAQPDELDDLVERAGVRIVAAVLLDRLGHLEVGLDASGLQHDADPLAEGVLAPRRVVTEHAHLAAVALAMALKDLDGGRLAGAVGAEQRVDLAARDLEVDAAHGLDRAVGLAQVAHRDRRVARHTPSLAAARARGREAGSATARRGVAGDPRGRRRSRSPRTDPRPIRSLRGRRGGGTPPRTARCSVAAPPATPADRRAASCRRRAGGSAPRRRSRGA